MKIEKQIFRFTPSPSMAKRIFARFDAKLRRVDIQSVDIKYGESGAIEKVDIIYLNHE